MIRYCCLLAAGTAVQFSAISRDANAQTVVGGGIYTNTTWTLVNSPYELSAPIVVGNNATLTIEPGVEIRIGSGHSISVGSVAGGTGTLIARGTSQQPITITSLSASPSPGDWGFVLFADAAVDTVLGQGDEYLSGSVLSHVRMEFGGSGGTTTGVVTMRSASVLLEHLSISDSPRPGVFADFGLTGLPLRLRDTVIERCVATQAFQKMGVSINNGQNHEIVRCTIRDCLTPDSGGGIWAINALGITIRETTITGCQAGTQGGAGRILGGDGLVVRDTQILDNRGAGIAGLYISCDDALLERVTFRGNETISTNGSEAAMHFDSRRGIIRDCDFISNRANTPAQSTAGALLLTDSDILVEDCLFEDNSATDAYGAVECVAPATTFRRCVFRNNHVVGENGKGGGALYVRQASTTIEDCEFIENSAPGDGGALLSDTQSSDLRIIRTTFTNNVSGANGGAVHLKGSGAVIEDCLFDTNDAVLGGALFVGSTASGPVLRGYLQSGVINTFLSNTAEEGSAVYNNLNYSADGSGDLSLADNCWGFASPAQIQGMIFDFFDDPTKGLAAVPRSAPCTCPADVNVDGVLSPADYIAWISAYYDQSALADQNADGLVTIADFNAWIANYNAGC